MVQQEKAKELGNSDGEFKIATGGSKRAVNISKNPE